jgi:Asp-tRNA(Asn)/Glu-tRNA(Gln) amidotransferase A subunit family amidase
LRHQYNPSINAFITITREQALAAAREMEAEQRAGKWRAVQNAGLS